MNRTSLFGTFIAITSLWLTACGPEPVEPPPSNEFTAHAYVLNEGDWGKNNASLSCIDTAKGEVINGYFAQQNGRGLGSVAQDMVAYGTKLYIVVWESNTIEVLDLKNGRSIKQINMGNRGPRYIAFDHGKGYISCYDKSIARLDTASLEIDARCPLSRLNPEQLCIVGSSLFVCSSWQESGNGNYLRDSVLIEVDLPTFSEKRTIVVGLNPTRVAAFSDGRIVVGYSGDYASNIGGTVIYDPTTGSLSELNVTGTGFQLLNDYIYLYASTYNGGRPSASFYRIDSRTLEKTQILKGYSSDLGQAYAIAVTNDGRVFVCNSPANADGDLYCFSPDGVKLWSCEVGRFASHVLFF